MLRSYSRNHSNTDRNLLLFSYMERTRFSSSFSNNNNNSNNSYKNVNPIILKSSLEKTLTTITKKHLQIFSPSSSSLFSPLSTTRTTTTMMMIPIMDHLKNSSSQKRLFWSERKIQALEKSANDPQNKLNTKKQNELYKELLKTGNYALLVSRFESQPQLGKPSSQYPVQERLNHVKFIQQDVDCLKSYITALVMDSNIDRLARQMSLLVKGSSSSSNSTHTNTAGNGSGATSTDTDHSFGQEYLGNQGVNPYLITTSSTENGPRFHEQGKEFVVESANGQPLPQWLSKTSNKGPSIYSDQVSSSTMSAKPDRVIQMNQKIWKDLQSRKDNFISSFNNQPRFASFNNPFNSNTNNNNNKQQDSSFKHQGRQEQEQPLHIVVSEAWSWGKLMRKLGTRVLTTVLVLTGISVVLDQQGIIRAGMNAGEPEPFVSKDKVVFADVQGVDEAKQDLEEVVEFLKEPKKFMTLGGKLPKGVLLYGPPGTGKTMLAKAVAGEAGVPFFQMSGSEFDEMYVGVGAKRVRELFQAARKRAPCIVFIDELDAVGSKRNAKDHGYMRQTLNQLLVELDGFSSSEGVIFIGATNSPDSLDKALTRPGRLDKLVPVPLPDIRGRIQILKIHSNKVSMGEDVKLDVLARGTPGFSGADLANLVNQAALKASKDNSRMVSMYDLEWAKDKIIMGAERKSAVISEENKLLTAYHEGGHALVALYTKGAMPLHKVTVIPRGRALGVTVQLPDEDVLNYTKKEIKARIDVCMGGLVAEEIVGGSNEAVSTGPSNDLKQATELARSMVLTYGMSEKVGFISVDDLNKLSGDMRSTVDSEIRNILQNSYERAKKLIESKRKELDILAKSLVEYETLSVEEVEKVLKGEKLQKNV